MRDCSKVITFRVLGNPFVLLDFLSGITTPGRKQGYQLKCRQRAVSEFIVQLDTADISRPKDHCDPGHVVCLPSLARVSLLAFVALGALSVIRSLRLWEASVFLETVEARYSFVLLDLTQARRMLQMGSSV